MIISANIKCKWCGEEITITEKKTTRSFNIALNRLKRIHDWGCEEQGKAKQKITEAKKVVSDALNKMANVS